MLSSRWLWPVFFRISEYRDIKKQFHWPKKDSDNCYASYKIVCATTEWKLKTKSFEKKLPSQWKNKLIYFFSYYRVLQTSITILSRSIKYSSKIGASKKVISQRLIKCWKKRQKSKHSNEKKVSFFLLVLPSMKNLKKPFIRVHEVFWQLLHN